MRDAWNRKRLALDDEIGDEDEGAKKKLGRSLNFRASLFQVPLRNRDELWLSAGSYHLLADRLLVGWHPEYAKHLTDGE